MADTVRRIHNIPSHHPTSRHTSSGAHRREIGSVEIFLCQDETAKDRFVISHPRSRSALCTNQGEPFKALRSQYAFRVLVSNHQITATSPVQQKPDTLL